MKFPASYFRILSFLIVFGISLYLNAREKLEIGSDKFTFDNIIDVQDNHEKFVLIRMTVSAKDDEVNINLDEIKTIKGYYKENTTDYLSRNEGDWVCQILNDQEFVIKELIVKNPLIVRLEYPNDDKTIGSKEVLLSEKEVMIRFNYNPDMKSLNFSRINTNGKLEKVKTIPLKDE